MVSTYPFRNFSYLLSKIKLYIKEILTSPKLRAKQTAEIIAKPHSLPIYTDERLIERLEWENDVSFDEFIDEWNKTEIDRSYQPKKGISSSANGKQMIKYLTNYRLNIKKAIFLLFLMEVQ